METFADVSPEKVIWHAFSLEIQKTSQQCLKFICAQIYQDTVGYYSQISKKKKKKSIKFFQDQIKCIVSFCLFCIYLYFT